MKKKENVDFKLIFEKGGNLTSHSECVWVSGPVSYRAVVHSTHYGDARWFTYQIAQ